MSRLEAAFNEAFKDMGGIHRGGFSKLSIVRELLKYARAEIMVLRRLEKNIPPIYIDLIDNYTLNASAKKLGDQYFIGINIGAILQTFHVFSRMLSCNTILKDIGNVDSENPPKKVFDAQLKEATRSLSFYTRDLIPKDPVRKATSKIFMKHVLDFLLFHEYAHIVYGHLDYCLENSHKKGTESDTLMRQALEVSADSFSTFTSLTLINEMNMEVNPVVPQELLHLYKDPKQVVRMWFFPVYTYFRLFGFANSRHSIKTDTHPSPACRANLIMENIHSFWDCKYDYVDTNALAELCIDIIIDVENAFGQISEQGLDIRSIQASISDEHLSHTNLLFARQYEIMKLDLLKGYSYIPWL